MIYILVENKTTVILGPMTWKPRLIQSELNDLEVDYTVSPTEPYSYIKLNDNFEIYPVVDYITPDLDDRYEELGGPTWTFTEYAATPSFFTVPKSIEEVRNGLKATLASNRYNKQLSGVEVTLGDETFKVGTDIETLNKYISLIASIGESTINYKVNNTFVSVNASDLQTIVNAINTHVQTQFDWEKTVSESINVASDIETLKAISVE